MGRLGFLLNLAAGFALVWIMAVVGIGCFVGVGHYFGSVWVSAVAYAACVVIVYMLIARAPFTGGKVSVHTRRSAKAEPISCRNALALLMGKSRSKLCGVNE
jgi:membrane protein implicated in regulation of membrane protease activity